VSICLVAGSEVAFDECELNAALRRALVVRAVGGDPHRELGFEEEAITRLADELDDGERRDQLQAGLEALRPLAEGRPAVREAIAVLVAEPELAWRALCAARLADALD
jgi:hypothetical protein